VEMINKHQLDGVFLQETIKSKFIDHKLRSFCT